MLIRFNVKNFLSFDTRDNGSAEEFSMIAGKVRNKKEHIYENENIRLLKFAAVYGANAAGKSNLVKALGFMQYTIAKGLPSGHTEQYCKVTPENKHKTSYFELELMLDGKYYAYGFEAVLSQSKFVSEWLVELYADNSEKVIFERNIDESTFVLGTDFKEKGLEEKLDIYAGDISSDETALFLTVMNQNKRNLYQKYEKAAIFQQVFWWIKNELDINFPNDPISDYSYLSEADDVKEVCKVISAFGTGITNFKMSDVPIERVLGSLPEKVRNRLIEKIEKGKADIRSNPISEIQMVMRSSTDFFVIILGEEGKIRCQTIEFSHGEKDVLFQLSEESDGTVRMLDLLEILLAGGGKTYVIDELDRCLHPNMTYKFVETFLQAAAKKDIQLIVTTHESRLLDADLLRRDEIWFVDKRKNGESGIYSLEEYNSRFDQKIDKAYLEGRYGGVPVFHSVFPIEGNLI